LTYLVDTNVVSQLRRRSRVNARAVAWFGSVEPGQLHVSAVTVFEIAHGIAQLARSEPIEAARLRRWLENAVIAAFSGRILPVDGEVAVRAAELHVGRTRLDADRFIAATALTHGLIVLTRNVRDFTSLGVRTVNPFAP
jgi:hypothetical protein